MNYATPAADASEKYFITPTDVGRTAFRCSMLSRRYTAKKRSSRCTGAAVADDGSFILLTRSADYTSRVMFYDRDCSTRASYYGRLCIRRGKSSGDFAAVTSVEADGKFRSKINVFRWRQVPPIRSRLRVCGGGSCRGRISGSSADGAPARTAVCRQNSRWRTGHRHFAAISAGRIADTMQKSKNTGNYAVKVFDKTEKSVYNRDVAPDAE